MTSGAPLQPDRARQDKPFVSPYLIWGLIVLAVLPIPFFGEVFLLARKDSLHPCLYVSPGWIFVQLLPIVPSVAILLLLQLKKYSQGAALALAWAPMACCWVIKATLDSSVTDTYYYLTSVMFYRNGSVIFVCFILMTIWAGRLYYKLRNHSPARLAPMFVASFGFSALIMIAGLHFWPIDYNPNQWWVTVDLGLIHTLEIDYSKESKLGFSRSLLDLGPPLRVKKSGEDGMSLVSYDSGFWFGRNYTFNYSAGPADNAGRILSFTVKAHPFSPLCGPNFFMDQTGKVHVTFEDRFATAQDPLTGMDQLQLVSTIPYSCLSATMGSTFVARRAGM